MAWNNTSSSYRSSLHNWFNNESAKFPGMLGDFSRSFPDNYSDSMLYGIAYGLYVGMNNFANYNYVQKKPENEDSRLYYLVPEVMGDGSIYWIDRTTNSPYAIVKRQPNGLYSFYGPKEAMTRLWGRSELGGMNDGNPV